MQKIHLDSLNNPSSQEVNRIFVLSFKDDDERESHNQYYLRTVELKDEKFCFISQWKMILQTYDNIKKIAAVQGDDTQQDVY